MLDVNSNNPLVSIIIVNYNGKTFLEDCFKSLKQVSYSNFEIILVDNNSTDDSIAFIKNNYPSTIIIKLDDNYGFAYPNNVGAKNARGDLLLFLNNDTKVTPDFISEIVDVITKDQKIAICQSLLLKPNGEVDSSGDYVDTMGIAFSSKEKVEKIREILSAKGAAMMVRKDVFKKLGGFDEQFFVSFEDVDLGWRAWILGYKVVVIPQSVVYHIGGQTIKKIQSEISFHGFKNQLSMKITNFENSNMIKSLFLFFIIYGFRMLRVQFDYKFKGSTKITATKYEEKIAQKPNLVAIFKALGWILGNSNYIRKKRKQVNSSRLVSTKQLEEIEIIRSRK